MAASSSLTVAPSDDAAVASASRHDHLWIRIAALAAVAFTLGNTLWAAWDQGLTYDEYYHLEWPRRLLYEGVDERESAMRFDSKTPVLMPSVMATAGAERLGYKSEQTLRFISRLTPAFFLVVCLGLSAALARSIDSHAGWLACLLVALDPNMAANGSIATSDVAYAMAVLMGAWTLMRRNSSWFAEAMIGAAIGFAFAVKYSAVLLVPVALGATVFQHWRRPPTLLFRLFVMTGAACLTVSALYLMVGVGVPLGSLSFRTPILQDIANGWPSVRLPFPRSILTGIDISKNHNDRGWNCYIFGEMHPHGVWYYFVAHWLMKTPVALGLAVLVGLWHAFRARIERSVVILTTLFVVHLVYFSLFFSTQIGIRYALLCIPLASIVAACGLARLPPLGSTRWLLVMAALAIAERAPYWGDPIAFTNLSVWPKSRAYWYTADSNLDYGQNRERLQRYVKESELSAVVDQAVITPGLYVVGANDLTQFGNFKSHRWLIDNDIPAVNFGFTHFGFSITGERFESFMNEARVVPSLREFDDLCSGELPHYAPRTQIPFVQKNHPDGGRLWVICAESKKGADIGLTVLSGRLFFGRLISKNECSTDFLQANQSAWFRIPTEGRGALCIREVPFRRTFLPYLVDAYVTVRGRGADVDIRQIPTDRVSTPSGQETIP